MHAPPPPAKSPFLYSFRQGTGSSFSVSAMPFCIWIAAALSRSGYPTAKLSSQKYRTGCWAVLSNGRALQRSWFSAPLPIVRLHAGAAALCTCHLLPSTRPDPAATKTTVPPWGRCCQWSEVGEPPLLTPSSSPRPHSSTQADPPCFLRGLAQPRCPRESPAAVENFIPVLACFVSQWQYFTVLCK